MDADYKSLKHLHEHCQDPKLSPLNSQDEVGGSLYCCLCAFLSGSLFLERKHYAAFGSTERQS